MRKIYSFSIGLLVLLLIVTNATALPNAPQKPKPIYHQIGDQAFSELSIQNIDPSWYSGGYAQVFSSADAKEAYLDLNIYAWDWYSENGFYGYYSGPIDPKKVEVNGKGIKVDISELPLLYSDNLPSKLDVKLSWTKDGYMTSTVNRIIRYPDVTYKENKEVSSAQFIGLFGDYSATQSQSFSESEIVNINNVQKI